MKLASNALISLEYYRNMMGIDQIPQGETEKIIGLINSVSVSFENICNRILKARTFDYEPKITVDNELVDNPDYLEKYSVFDSDGINGSIFYFPTYPVNSITKFMINGVEITEAIDHTDFDGYHLYKSKGKLVYYSGFCPGYFKNIKIKWNGGYRDTDAEMEELKYLCFDMVRTLLNTPVNPNLQSEKIGNYAYTNYSISDLYKLKGLNPKVYSDLMRYRKEVI